MNFFGCFRIGKCVSLCISLYIFVCSNYCTNDFVSSDTVILFLHGFHLDQTHIHIIDVMDVNLSIDTNISINIFLLILPGVQPSWHQEHRRSYAEAPRSAGIDPNPREFVGPPGDHDHVDDHDDFFVRILRTMLTCSSTPSMSLSWLWSMNCSM